MLPEDHRGIAAAILNIRCKNTISAIAKALRLENLKVKMEQRQQGNDHQDDETAME